MNGIATLTVKNQLTLPTTLVTSLSLSAGSKFWIKSRGGEIVLKPVGSLREVQGILETHPLSKKYDSSEIVQVARKKKIARLFE